MRPCQPQAWPWRPSVRTRASGIVVPASVISLGGRPALLFMTHPVCRSLCTKSTQITICRISHELDPKALARARPVYQRSLASSQKGQISLRCCCQNSFCSTPPKKNTSCLLSFYTRPRIQGRALHHPVSEPPPVNRRFMGTSWVRQALASLGGCHGNICIPGILSVV